LSDEPKIITSVLDSFKVKKLLSQNLTLGKRARRAVVPNWGSLDLREAAEEEKLPILTDKYISDKKDLNQLRAEPFSPTRDSNLDKQY